LREGGERLDLTELGGSSERCSGQLRKTLNFRRGREKRGVRKSKSTKARRKREEREPRMDSHAKTYWKLDGTALKRTASLRERRRADC